MAHKPKVMMNPLEAEHFMMHYSLRDEPGKILIIRLKRKQAVPV
jgi:hypothetical protein